MIICQPPKETLKGDFCCKPKGDYSERVYSDPIVLGKVRREVAFACPAVIIQYMIIVNAS